MKFHIETACLPPLVQSSCTTPYLEAENACMQNMQGLSQLKYRTTSILRNNDQGKQVEHLKPYKQSIIPECKTRGTIFYHVPYLCTFVI